MSQYPKLSLSMRKDISDTTVDTMDMIAKLDKVSEKLSRILNKKLKKLDLPEKAFMLQRTSVLANSKYFQNQPSNGFSEEHDEANSIHHPETSASSSSCSSSNTKDHDQHHQSDDFMGNIPIIISEEDQKEREKFLTELEEINQMRKVIEIIAAKKVELAIKNYDFIDLNIKTIDAEMTLLETAIKASGNVIPIEMPAGEMKSDGVAVGMKRKVGDAAVDTVETPIETTTNSEPVYCICKRIAFGEMIACDNEDCPVEWFHYPCVNLTRKPKNSWICSLCSNRKKK